MPCRSFALTERESLFQDIFGEPDTTHSFDAVWRLVHRVFTFTRCIFYKLFALIFALPAAILFGFLFAVFTAFNTFLLVPLAKLLTIPGAWIAKVCAVSLFAVCSNTGSKPSSPTVSIDLLVRGERISCIEGVLDQL